MRRSCWSFSALSALSFAILSSPANADTACPAPPDYQLLRQDEDYSYLSNPSCKTDSLDALKFVPLNNGADRYLALGGEAREWYEGFENANWGQGPQDSNGYSLQRLSAYADWHFGQDLRFFGELSSATEAGRVGGPRPLDEDQLWLEEGFVELNSSSLPGVSSSLRLGRQEFEFGSGRFVDVREGPNVRQAFDGVSATFAGSSWKATAFATRPVLNRPGILDDPSNPNTLFWGVYATKMLGSIGGGIDFYYLGINNTRATYQRGTGREIRQTLGVRAWGHRGDWDYDWELTYQGGTFSGAPIEAYAFGTDTGYNFSTALFKPRISVKTAVTSGDQNNGKGPLGTFDPLFPSGIYFGEAAIGLNGPSNLLRFGASIQAHLSESVQVGIDYDLFWRNSLNDGVYGLGVNLLRSGQDNRQRFIGSQPSASIVWRANRHLSFSVAYAYFAVGPFLSEGPSPGRDVQYASGAIDYKF
jgi:hypothetical protein